MKAARELGSERRETVRSISGVGDKVLKAPLFSTRGPKETYPWSASYCTNNKRWVAMFGYDNC